MGGTEVMIYEAEAPSPERRPWGRKRYAYVGSLADHYVYLDENQRLEFLLELLDRTPLRVLREIYEEINRPEDWNI